MMIQQFFIGNYFKYQGMLYIKQIGLSVCYL